jgi:hypothetical protein
VVCKNKSNNFGHFSAGCSEVNCDRRDNGDATQNRTLASGRGSSRDSDVDWEEMCRRNADKLREKKARDAEAIKPIQSRLLQLGMKDVGLVYDAREYRYRNIEQ